MKSCQISNANLAIYPVRFENIIAQSANEIFRFVLKKHYGANESNYQDSPFLHFLEYDPKEVKVLINLVFLVLVSRSKIL